MSAMRLNYVTNSAIHTLRSSSRIQSLSGALAGVNPEACAAAIAKVGKGFLGYINDLENKGSSQNLMMVML